MYRGSPAIWTVANTARGGIAAAREPDLIMADLSVFSHVDLDSGFDLDLDVLVLDRFSQAPILWNEGAVAEYNVWVWQ